MENENRDTGSNKGDDFPCVGNARFLIQVLDDAFSCVRDESTPTKNRYTAKITEFLLFYICVPCKKSYPMLFETSVETKKLGTQRHLGC